MNWVPVFQTSYLGAEKNRPALNTRSHFKGPACRLGSAVLPQAFTLLIYSSPFAYPCLYHFWKYMRTHFNVCFKNMPGILQICVWSRTLLSVWFTAFLCSVFYKIKINWAPILNDLSTLSLDKNDFLLFRSTFLIIPFQTEFWNATILLVLRGSWVA